jgi:hypothetical protein
MLNFSVLAGRFPGFSTGFLEVHIYSPTGARNYFAEMPENFTDMVSVGLCLIM